MADYETLLVEQKGAAVVITVNRPKALNALNAAVIVDLSHAIEAVQTKGLGQGVAGVVITGAGDKAFVAGADIRAMSSMGADEAQTFAAQGHGVAEAIAHLGVPVIAAVNGFALGGGCELALACDFAYASENAKFGQPEVNLGVIPGFGGTQRLLRRVGQARALELCVTGELFDAKTALEWGLVNRVCAPGEVLSAALATIELIAKKGPLAVAAAKRVVHEGAQLPLAAANQLEIDAFGQLFGSEDQSEGMKAFIEKRPAAFSGK